MILRRITSAFKRQDWFTVGIETLIVVLGVFLGLQANNWNAARADQALEKEYLGRLQLDISDQIASLTEQKQYYEQARRHARAADHAFRQPVNSLGAQFLIDLYQASQRVNQSPPKGTYDELVSTGRITLIGDLETRNMLRAHYAVFAGAMLTILERSDYRPRVREEIDDSIQRQIRKNCGDVVTPDADGVAYHVRLRPDCTIKAPPAIIAENVKRLHDNGEIRKLLRFQLDILDNRIVNLNGLIEASRRLRTYLESVKE
ncbi:MAG: hypothetical protein R3C60_10265 [Parvularculaceae bacterium]